MENQKKLLHKIIIILLCIQPLIDMDYLVYPFLNRFGIPRLSTILRFIVIPLVVLFGFLLHEKRKKRVFLLASLYGLSLLIYFFFHVKQAQYLYTILDFTPNFRFSVFQELTYILTLVIPYGLVYCCYHEKFTEKEFSKITCFLSGSISIPILIGDLFVFGKSTYYKYTVANIFSWFTGIYNHYHPRTLASKFFFNEGNTIGIILFMLLPIMYYLFTVSKERKVKRIIAVFIVIQSLAMQILATRVATYGAVLFAGAYIVFYLFFSFYQKQKVQKWNVLFYLFMLCVTATILPFTPAVQNQKVDAKNDVALLSNGMAAFGEKELEEGKDLIPGSPEYINFYVYMFETYGINARYIQSVPSMYYTEYYSYQHDPKFWVDVTFMPVFDRVSGRQIETIFFKYKYQHLSFAQKFLGMGYSTFMNGSIVLEKDFAQQIYTLGYIGEILCIMPWLFICLVGCVIYLKNFKKYFTLKTVSIICSVAIGAFGSAWMSGHMLDQFVTTSYLALLIAILLNQIGENV